MKINVRGNELVKMSDNARDYIINRVESLKKLFNQSENVIANVLCKGTEKNVIVEITIPLKHIILRAESKADTLYGAIDLATDKIERQLLRHKQKVNTIIKKREGISNYFSNLESKDEDKNLKIATKMKVINPEVMTLDEAITKMEMLDHGFFSFINEANHRHTVVYLRKDGGYGTIETKE